MASSRKSPKRPDWKAKLKQACLERMRDTRNQVLWQARSSTSPPQKQVIASTMEDILSKELQNLKSSYKEGDMIWDHTTPKTPIELSNEEYEALMLAMQAALYDEQATEHDMIQAFENARLEQDFSAAYLLSQQENAVPCPICKKAYLSETKTSPASIICSSGCLKLTIQHDKIGLEFLRRRFAELLQDHFESGCRSQPFFTFQKEFNIQSLYVQCESCEFFEVV